MINTYNNNTKSGFRSDSALLLAYNLVCRKISWSPKYKICFFQLKSTQSTTNLMSELNKNRTYFLWHYGVCQID